MRVTTVDTIDQLADAVRAADRINLVGMNSKPEFRMMTAEQRGPELRVALEGIVDFSPTDQVVVVKAGTKVLDLLGEIGEKDQTLPFPMIEEIWPYASGFPGTVGGTIAMNLPHGLEAQCGSWRDWVLGMTIVLADGTIAKSGSRAVKNVAGFDLHKFFVGSRGTLGAIAEVTLKTWPKKAVPKPNVQVFRKWGEEPDWIQRTLRSELSEALYWLGDKIIAVDWESSTIWAGMEPEDIGKKFDGDWYIRAGYVCGEMNWPNEAHTELTKRAKAVFDPTNKFFYGEVDIS